MKKMIGIFVQNHLFLNMKVENVISTRILFLTIFKFLNLFDFFKIRKVIFIYSQRRSYHMGLTHYLHWLFFNPKSIKNVIKCSRIDDWDDDTFGFF
jgi:hypothetical protein